MQALAVQAQFAGGLRAAQHQHGKQRRGLGRHTEHLFQPMLETDDAAAADFDRQAGVLEVVEGCQDFRFAQIEHRLAAGLLVAAGGQRVER